MQTTDYGNSYLVWTSHQNPADDRQPGHMPYQNTVRIQLDSRCWVTDGETGQTTEYCLISPCRTEWMYRDEPLWQQPNYEFSGIFSRDICMYGHIKAGEIKAFGGDWRVASPTRGRFLRCEVVVRSFPEARRLEGDEETIAATMIYDPIVAHTEVRSEDGRMRATIEYPIKTMNVALDEGRMQVDTGPVIFPDFAATVEHEIERLHWAFVCYNTDSVAEFVLRGPTPVVSGGAEAGHYIDYSDVRRVEMKNTLYAATL